MITQIIYHFLANTLWFTITYLMNSSIGHIRLILQF